MKSVTNIIGFCVFTITLLSGCVSTDDYNKKQEEVNAVRAELDGAKAELAKANELNTQLKTSLTTSESSLASVTAAKDTCDQKSTALEAQVAELNAKKSTPVPSAKKIKK